MYRTRNALCAALFAILAALCYAPPPAQATILFAGGEDVDFLLVGTVNVFTSGCIRTGYARLCLTPANNSSMPPGNYFKLVSNLSNQTTLWIHSANIQGNTLNGTVNNGEFIGIYGSDGVRRLMIRGTGNNSQVKISKRNSANTFTDLVTCTLGSWPIASGIVKLDWFINYAVAGEVTLYVNGVQFCDYQGDVTTDGITAINNVDFTSSSGNTNTMNWSEIILATTDTRSMNLVTCAPQANGTNMAWTGSFANVNGTTANDASPLTSGTSNQVAEFTCPSLPSGTFSVPAVVQSARVLKGSSGPSTFRFIMRPALGSTDYDSGSDIGLSFGFGNFQNIWALNPSCSCAWTTSDLSTGVNQGLKSRP